MNGAFSNQLNHLRNECLVFGSGSVPAVGREAHIMGIWAAGHWERERDKNDQSALCDKGLFALLSGKGGL